MAFWLLRGVIALVAVAATLVPAGAAAMYGWDVLETRQMEQEREADAHQELLLFQNEIQLAENRARARSGSADFLQERIVAARLEWTGATDDWRRADYGQMAEHLITGRQILSDVALIEPMDEQAFRDRGWSDAGPATPALRSDVAAIGLIAAAVLWTIWGGMAARGTQPVPVPVFPGEVELRKPEEPEDPAPAEPRFGDGAEARPAPPSAEPAPRSQHQTGTTATATTAVTAVEASRRQARDPRAPRVTRKVKAKPLPPLQDEHDDDPVTPS